MKILVALLLASIIGLMPVAPASAHGHYYRSHNGTTVFVGAYGYTPANVVLVGTPLPLQVSVTPPPAPVVVQAPVVSQPTVQLTAATTYQAPVVLTTQTYVPSVLAIVPSYGAYPTRFD